MVVSGKTLIVSRDRALAAELQRFLQCDHGCRVEGAGSFAEAEGMVRRRLPAAVFVDLRPEMTGEDPSALLGELSRQDDRCVSVLAISDAGYICDWAAVADRVVRGRLTLPLDRRQLARLLESELARRASAPPAGDSTPHVVRSRTVCCRTGTPEMIELLEDLSRMAARDEALLLVGEPGTGKATLARLVHELSPRQDARLLSVVCGAIPAERLEADLFGHVARAASGADRSRIGKFEAARDGTLLLSEVDVLDSRQQAQLLRVIETGEFEPVGAGETRRSRARLIVTSKVDLQPLMERRELRADLYYRLNRFEFRVPPLRDRQPDIVPLALEFIRERCAAHRVCIRRVHPDFLGCLRSHEWPGNIRELKSRLRRAVLLCHTDHLTPNDLGPHFLKVLRDRSEGGGVRWSRVPHPGGPP